MCSCHSSSFTKHLAVKLWKYLHKKLTLVPGVCEFSWKIYFVFSNCCRVSSKTETIRLLDHRLQSMMAETTVSRGWREKGNISYKNFTDSNSVERQRNYLQSALMSYYRAYETSGCDEDKSSAAKNYGTAAWRLATVLKMLDEKTCLCSFRFREAIKYFSEV